jgi:hypothetical protein
MQGGVASRRRTRVPLAPWMEGNLAASPRAESESGEIAECLSPLHSAKLASSPRSECALGDVEEEVEAPQQGAFAGIDGDSARPPTAYIAEEVKEVLAARMVHQQQEQEELDPSRVVDSVCAIYGFELGDLHDLMPVRPTLDLPAIAGQVPAKQRKTSPKRRGRRASSHTPSKNRGANNMHDRAHAAPSCMRVMDAHSRAKERERLQRDIQSLKSDVKKKRPTAHNESLQLAHVLGAYARPSANALEKTYTRNPEALHMALTSKRQTLVPAPPEHDRCRPGGRRTVQEPLSLKRRSASVDPDSPSRRKTLQSQGFFGSAQDSRGRRLLQRTLEDDSPRAVGGSASPPVTVSAATRSPSPSPRVYRPPSGALTSDQRTCTHHCGGLT